MKINLNYWQTSLLFLPFIVGAVIIDIPQKGLYNYQTTFAIANFLSVFNLCLAIDYQALLTIGFYHEQDKPSVAYKVNALIPAVFFTLYLIYVTYLTWIKSAMHNSRFTPGPLHRANISTGVLIILLFLIYALINFLFVNNYFVARTIKRITNDDEQTKLKFEFLMPMKRLVKTGVWICVGTLIFSAIYDIACLTTVK